jgi:two-component system, OmpR family, sensor kinase
VTSASPLTSAVNQLQTVFDERDAARAELAAVRREMQALTATLGHDLHAPLRHIVAYTQLVQEDAGPQLTPEVQGFLATITDSARHLGAMLDGLLELSRIGAVAVQLEAVDLSAALQSAAAAHPGITLVRDEARALADPALLQLVLTQLLANAVKFSRGRAPPDITVCTTQQGDTVQITVQDKGAGFNPAQAAKLGQAFVRLHSPRQFPGLGMGLALAHKAVQRMGGSLTLTAAVDAGCAATLVLPAAAN